eukprot:4773692-Amphidinium_carterae.1
MENRAHLVEWVSQAMESVSTRPALLDEARNFMGWCGKQEAIENAIAHAAHGLLFWKGRGTVPPELLKADAAAAAAAAAAVLDDVAHEVVDGDQEDEAVEIMEADFYDDLPDPPA